MYYLVCLAWIAIFVTLALGHYRTARVLAALAVVPGLVALLQAQLTGVMPAPFGPWIFWVLVDLAPVLAMTAFHRDAPPAAPGPWLLALPAGYVLVYGPLLALQATGNSAWLPDFSGLCCILVSLACLAHAPRAWSRQAAGTGPWSLTLVLLAAVAGAYRIVTLTDYLHDPHLIEREPGRTAHHAGRRRAGRPRRRPRPGSDARTAATIPTPWPPREDTGHAVPAPAPPAVRPGQRAGRRGPRARRCRLQQHHPARAGPGASEPATGTRSGVTDHHASHAQPAPHSSRRVPGRLNRALRVGAQRAAGRGSFVTPRAGRHREHGHPHPRRRPRLPRRRRA